jgi:pilus assembly protein Flp/PilA
LGEAGNTLRSTINMISTYEFLATWLRARFSDSERGASLVEYALLVALIAIVCVIAVQILGKQASTSFSETGSGLTAGN